MALGVVRIIRIGALLLVVLLVGNLLVYAFLLFTPQGKRLADEGVVLKLKSSAFIFAHGSYHFFTKDGEAGMVHLTILNNRTIATQNLIDNLHKQGIKYIFLSQCEAGDNAESILWNETVTYWDKNINRGKGKTIPFFMGVGFIHLPIPLFAQKWGM